MGRGIGNAISFGFGQNRTVSGDAEFGDTRSFVAL